MSSFDQVSLTCEYFKCFGVEESGFQSIRPLNIIIGRNNSGKTTLIDLVEYAVKPTPLAGRGHQGNSPKVMLKWPLTESRITAQFDKSAQPHMNDGNRSWEFNARQWALTKIRDQPITFCVDESGQLSMPSIEQLGEPSPNDVVQLKWATQQLRRQFSNPFALLQFRRIVADRDIQSESESSEREISVNGQGTTGVIARYLNYEHLPSRLIEETLLAELNRIFAPDTYYSRILVQRKDNDRWEIYLEEPRKGRIPVSQTGSGFKTVLLVLVNLIVVPAIVKKPLSEFLFAFEELENNLHPAVQRRLFSYLRNMAEKEKCYFFLTTHSNVVIDQFSADPLAQILHVTHDGEKSTVNVVEASSHGRSVLEDLDVRASDLLQTNVVVWVEGPSDRTYFNRWIKLWSDGKLEEGQHYQCLPYGGSVGTHFSFDDPEWVEELIPALKINRHAIVLMDSDKNTEGDELKPHVTRIVDEVAKIGGMAWVTVGKEVENYIPANTFVRLLANDKLLGPGQFKSVLQYVAARKGHSTEPRKVELAHQVADLMTRDELAKTLDLAERLNVVCATIRGWNRLPVESTPIAS